MGANEIALRLGQQVLAAGAPQTMDQAMAMRTLIEQARAIDRHEQWLAKVEGLGVRLRVLARARSLGPAAQVRLIMDEIARITEPGT